LSVKMIIADIFRVISLIVNQNLKLLANGCELPYFRYECLVKV
jgi:hypothetical protein